MKTIYLAGPLLSLTQEEANKWRAYVIDKLVNRYNFINPARRIFEYSNFKYIVESDKEDLDNSDIILINHLFASDGTAMEQLYSWQQGKEILVVVNGSHSPWIKYHSSHIFGDIDSCICYLENQSLMGGTRNDAPKLFDRGIAC